MATNPPETLESRSYRTAGLILVFVVIVAIVFVLVRALVFDRPLNDAALQQALIAAGVGVTVTCLIVWLLNLLNILSIQEGWGKLLWSVLIASILGNSALVYKRISAPVATLAQLRVDCVRALVVGDEAAVHHPYALQGGMTYQAGERLSYFVAFSGFAMNDAGEFDLEFRTSAENTLKKSTNYWDDAFKGNYAKLLLDPKRVERTQEYRKVAPECVGNKILQAAFIYRLPTDLAAGSYLLRSTIRDKVSGAMVSDTMPFEVQSVNGVAPPSVH